MARKNVKTPGTVVTPAGKRQAGEMDSCAGGPMSSSCPGGATYSKAGGGMKQEASATCSCGACALCRGGGQGTTDKIGGGC